MSGSSPLRGRAAAGACAPFAFASFTFASLAVALFAGPRPAQAAYCPSYTPAQTSSGNRCAAEPQPGKNPTSAELARFFARVAGGNATLGEGGPPLPLLTAGCDKAARVAATVPCHVLQAITMQESGWRHFCVPTLPPGSVGAPERTLVTQDCGYGIAQVTSGMHVGDSPSFDRARVAADPLYNLAVGARILVEKWNVVGCVGGRDPTFVEDWYLALWAYNGLSYANHPTNPKLGSGRGPYNPKLGGAYTYQERVLGWMEFPPSAGHWAKLAAAYPDLADFTGDRAPRTLPAASCASPTACTSRRPRHRSPCGSAVTPEPSGPEPSKPDPSSPDPSSPEPSPKGDAGASGSPPPGGEGAPAAPTPPTEPAPGTAPPPVSPESAAPPSPPTAEDTEGCACHAGAGASPRGLPLVSALGALFGFARRWRSARARSREPRP